MACRGSSCWFVFTFQWSQNFYWHLHRLVTEYSDLFVLSVNSSNAKATFIQSISSKSRGCKDFWWPTKLCHVGIHSKALTAWVLSDEYPYARVSVIIQLFASFCIGKISHHLHYGFLFHSCYPIDYAGYNNNKIDHLPCRASSLWNLPTLFKLVPTWLHMHKSKSNRKLPVNEYKMNNVWMFTIIISK